MQVILTIFLTAAFGLSMLECQKANTNANVARTNTAVPATTPPADEAPRISLADAKADFDKGAAIFVDTRAEVAYKTEHIKGSVNLPMEAFESRYKEIPTDKKIIAYCS